MLVLEATMDTIAPDQSRMGAFMQRVRLRNITDAEGDGWVIESCWLLNRVGKRVFLEQCKMMYDEDNAAYDEEFDDAAYDEEFDDEEDDDEDDDDWDEEDED